MCYGLEHPLVIHYILHYKDIICYFGSLMVNSGHFQLTSTVSTIFVLVELVVISHGCLVVSSSHPQPSTENFHPLCQTPSHANAPNSAHHCAKFCIWLYWTWHTRNCAKFLWSAAENIFLTFFQLIGQFFIFSMQLF